MVIINRFGKVTGWNSVTMNILGRDLEGITEIDYSHSKEFESVKGAGEYPVGIGEGNYEAKFSFSVINEERLALLDSLPDGKKIWDIDPFDAIIVYSYKNKLYTDAVRNVIIKNSGVAVKQGDKSISYKFECYCSHVEENI